MAKAKSEKPIEGWLVMKTGFEGIERPYDLLGDLVREYGISEPKPNGHSEKTEVGEIVATAKFGTKNGGYRWTEWRDERSNAYIGCHVELYGLHVIELDWRFTLSKSGYEYTFQNGMLRVWFESDDEQRRFALFWHAKRGVRPAFEPAESPFGKS